MSYKMPKVGDYMICHTDLVMTDGLIAAKKGVAYKVDKTASNSWCFTNEQGEDQHFIRVDEDEWFRLANAEELPNEPRLYTEEELKDWCAKACEWCADVVPEYRTFNAFWEANKQK